MDTALHSYPLPSVLEELSHRWSTDRVEFSTIAAEFTRKFSRDRLTQWNSMLTRLRVAKDNHVDKRELEWNRKMAGLQPQVLSGEFCETFRNSLLGAFRFSDESLTGASPSARICHTIYKQLVFTQSVIAIETVRRRIQLFVFFHVVVALDYHSGEAWRTGGCERLTLDVAESRSKDEQEVTTTNVRKFVELGKGFDIWVQNLGNIHNLVLLPYDIPEALYADRHNHTKIPQRAESIQRLVLHNCPQQACFQFFDASVEKLIQDIRTKAVPVSLSIAFNEHTTHQRLLLSTPESSQKPLVRDRQLQRGITHDQNALQPQPIIFAARNGTLPEKLDDVTYIAMLQYSFGGAVPTFIFEQIPVPQWRWASNGTEEQLLATDAGLDAQIIEISLDSSRLTYAINSVSTQLMDKISFLMVTKQKKIWYLKALSVVCFVFPRQVRCVQVATFKAIIQELLPVLRKIMLALQHVGIPPGVSEEVAEVLLVASKAGNAVRRSILPLVNEIVDENSSLHIRAELALQQSISLRLEGDLAASEDIIHEFCCGCSVPNILCVSTRIRYFHSQSIDERMNALYGHLHRSHLENLVQCDKYEQAVNEVDDWNPPLSPSPLERRISSLRTVTISKIFRQLGLFQDARDRLILCLKLINHQETSRTQVLCSLADTYCDLRQLPAARALVFREQEREGEKSMSSKGYRRLSVSRLEIEFQSAEYEAARKSIGVLDTIFARLSNLDVSDQLLHMRTLIASAKLYHCESNFIEAIEGWRIVLRRAQEYGSFQGEGFTYGVAYLSLSLANLQINDQVAAETSFASARRILLSVARDYWIPTLVHWADDVAAGLKLLAGWSVFEDPAAARR